MRNQFAQRKRRSTEFRALRRRNPRIAQRRRRDGRRLAYSQRIRNRERRCNCRGGGRREGRRQGRARIVSGGLRRAGQRQHFRVRRLADFRHDSSRRAVFIPRQNRIVVAFHRK
jgi:hypothetical protein